MAKKIILIFLFFSVCILRVQAAEAVAQAQKFADLEPIKKDDRVLIMAPHPDDEAIGCAGVIQQALAKGAKVRIVYLTNGEHNQLAFIVYEKRLTFRKGEFIHMGEVRRKEAIEAMKLLGLNENDLIFLGYPDFGTFAMFGRYWGSKKPFKDLLTRISSVPYKDNFSFGAPYLPENILNDLKKVLLDYKPTKIFISHPSDVNVDHKTFYLFLQVALADLDKEIPRPKIYPYLIHRLGWPLPRHYHPELSLEPPVQFLDKQINWMKFPLTKEQLDKKYKTILCYRSQTQSSAFYLLSFARKSELFGDYSDIELAPQMSLKEKAVQFFGFSDMYEDQNTGVLGKIENHIQDKEQISYAVIDDSLLIRIRKEKEFNRRFSLYLYIFGYSYQSPFSSMPKIRIITKYKSFKVFGGRKMIKPEGASLSLEPNSLILRLPLKVLGDPEFILVSVRAYNRGTLPVESSGFRKIVVE